MILFNNYPRIEGGNIENVITIISPHLKPFITLIQANKFSETIFVGGRNNFVIKYVLVMIQFICMEEM